MTEPISKLEQIRTTKGKAFLSFSGIYCAPCKELAPYIEAALKRHPEVTPFKVEVTEEMDIARAFRVMSIPTIILLEDGVMINKKTSPCACSLDDFINGEEIDC